MPAWLTLSAIKWIAIGLAFLGLLIYIGALKTEVTYQKHEAQKWETTYVTYKTNVEGKIAALGSANGALTLQLKQATIARNEADNAARPKLIERINNATSSASIRIPATDVSLFNDAARSGSTDIQQPASANGFNASNPQPTGDTDFQEVQRLHEADSHELNLCRQSVIDWNEMWDKFSANVKASERVTQ
jgi:hypothetical protein